MENYRMKSIETKRRTLALTIAVLFHLGVLAGVWYASSSRSAEDAASVETNKDHRNVSRVKKA